MRLKILFSVLGLMPVLVFAQPQGLNPGNTPDACTDATREVLIIIDRLLAWATAVVVSLAVVFIIYAAFLILTAGGNEDKVKTGRNYIVYALVAVAVAALSMLIVDLIIELLGYSPSDLICY